MWRFGNNETVGGDEFDGFRALLDRNEEELEDMCAHFKRRKEIEENYCRDLEKLAKKPAEASAVDDTTHAYTSHVAWKKLLESTNDTADTHRSSGQQLESILSSLIRVRENFKNISKNSKADLRIIWKDYSDLRDAAVPKLKRIYQSKWEDLQAAKGKDQSNPKAIQASSKATTDFHNAEHGYRLGIQSLEERRKSLVTILDDCRQQLEKVEQDRLESLKTVLEKYQRIQAQSLIRKSEILKTLDAFVENVNSSLDVPLFLDDLAEVFPNPSPIHYDNVQVGKSKNLIFGISLSSYAESRGKLVPFVVTKMIEAIEIRGIDTEGLYRISGRLSELDSLRISIEKDEQNVKELFDAHVDIHSVSGLLKLYFRELPEPLFRFPANERLEYAKKPDFASRLPTLKGRVAQQSPAHLATLKVVLRHIALISTHSAHNKMGVKNLCKIWNTLFFSSNLQSSRKNAQRSVAEVMQELSATDVIVEDLIMYYKEVFGESIGFVVAKDTIKTMLGSNRPSNASILPFLPVTPTELKSTSIAPTSVDLTQPTPVIIQRRSVVPDDSDAPALPPRSRQASAHALPEVVATFADFSPMSLPTAVDAPLKASPVVQAPVLQVPAVQALVVKAPVDVHVPEVQGPVVQDPVVQAPGKEAPEIQAPSIQVPVADGPIVHAPNAEAQDVPIAADPAPVASIVEVVPQIIPVIEQGPILEAAQTVEPDSTTAPVLATSMEITHVPSQPQTTLTESPFLPIHNILPLDPSDIPAYVTAPASSQQPAREPQQSLDDGSDEAFGDFAGATFSTLEI